jgi:hypothetical protein
MYVLINIKRQKYLKNTRQHKFSSHFTYIPDVGLTQRKTVPPIPQSTEEENGNYSRKLYSFIYPHLSPSICLYVSSIYLSLLPIYLSTPIYIFVFILILIGMYVIIHIYFHVREFDYRRGLDWWLHLLTTYTHDSWLRFTVYCYTQTSLLTLLHSPLVVAW